MFLLGFVDCYLLHDVETEFYGVVCCGIKDSVENSLSQTSPGDSSCRIVAAVGRPSVIYVLSTAEVREEHSFSWTNQVYRTRRLLLYGIKTFVVFVLTREHKFHFI